MPTSEAEWLETARGFEKKWNFPHAIGSIDGKHIEIEKPSESGSLFYNYKHFFSVILFAMVNANYEFMFVHVGTNGCASDAAILKNTTFYRKLMEDKLNLPQPCPLSDGCVPVPYVCLGDSAFSLNRHIMKPFPFKEISHEKRIFNYRLSRARRVVENAFGILVQRFRVLRQSINVNVDNIDYIVLACCVLHNYLLKTSHARYLTSKSVDREDVTEMKFQPGEWRRSERLTPLEKCSTRQRNEEGNNIRNIFTEHFSGPGSVPFQEHMLRVVKLSDE